MTNILGYLLLMALLMFAFTERRTLTPVVFTIIPVAVFMAYWFYGIRKPLYAELLHLFFLGAVFYAHFAKHIF